MAEKNSPSDLEVQFAVGCSPACDVVRKPKRRKRKSRKWHRILGMFSALPLVWVMVTGVLLNHSEDLALDDKEVSLSWILSAYGMSPEGTPVFTAVHGKAITSWDGQVFFQDKRLELSGSFLGAAEDADGILVLSSDGALRLNLNGEVIEKLDEISLPTLPLEAISVDDQSVLIKNAEGWYRPDADWLDFVLLENVTAQSLGLKVLEDTSLQETLRVSWAGGGLPLSRIVLDLHAGNFLGAFAKYFYDFVVVCTLWLIGTGLVLQYRTARRNKS